MADTKVRRPRRRDPHRPRKKVMEVAQKESGTPFDMPGAELFHYEENGK